MKKRDTLNFKLMTHLTYSIDVRGEGTLLVTKGDSEEYAHDPIAWLMEYWDCTEKDVLDYHAADLTGRCTARTRYGTQCANHDGAIASMSMSFSEWDRIRRAGRVPLCLIHRKQQEAKR